MIKLTQHILFFIIVINTTIFASDSFSERDPFIPITLLTTATTPNPTLLSIWIPLYFANANQVVSFLSAPHLMILSPQGKIRADLRNNQIWLQDDATHLVQIKKLIQHLDKSGPQFLIRAKIINVDRQYQKALGVLFQTENQNTNPIAPLTLNEPNLTTGAGQFTVSIAKLAGDHLLNLQISALEQEGHASLISSPALMTLNNQPAIIESGAEVPYQESTSSGATSVSFKKAVLRLKVTPIEMPQHHILLHISLNQDKVSALTVNGVPAIQTQQITTQVVVRNKQTIVLGGILETTHATQNTSVPIVNHIPLVGELFQHHIKQTKQRELLIFITPSMLKALY
ncbi:MAG: hypothetical protein ACD_42C00225G0005 [uncultured bacterium]|nr:MAG: hypothetical protein ACD_42C00225G0005 [uncultured bacterium]OGT34067.1 MAG: hypothetical protein A3C44_08340 [Gammaproteobacteria bacterium RIFCSPHIGHO2_02_FULL_39_13]OGT49954.1 MAG: hypothetical protein A3E53_06235 [Gammaproteobacteria bacterium RIFCSPHIGHO2_12_FULL_39_24]